MTSFIKKRKRLTKKISRAIDEYFNCKQIEDFILINELTNGKFFKSLKDSTEKYLSECFNFHINKFLKNKTNFYNPDKPMVIE